MDKPFKKPTDDEIDEDVTAEADDDSAWGKTIEVRRPKRAISRDVDQIARVPITSDLEIMSGEPVFKGTRVPVTALLENIDAGLTVDEFIDNFPSVTREQAVLVLEAVKHGSRY